MRKLQLSAALSAALEDNELFPVVTDETTSEVEETLIELDESYDEARDAVEVVEELEDRGEQVEELVEAVESYIKQGGMSPEGATLYYMQLNRLGKGLEALHHGSFAVSTEDYASRDRMSASLEAAEKGKNFAAKIWDAIVAMAKAAKDAIVNFFGRLLNSNGTLKKKAEELKQRALKLRGVVGKDEKISGGTWARNLADRSGKIDPNGTATILKDLANALGEVSKSISNSSGNVSGTSLTDFTNALSRAGNSLPGSYNLEVTDEGNFSITRKEVASPGEIDRMNNKQVVTTCDSIVALVKVCDTFGKTVKDAMSKAEATVTKQAKTAGNATVAGSKTEDEHDTNKMNRGKLQEDAAGFRKFIATSRRAALEFPRIATDAARSALVYCNKSLSDVSQTEKEGQAAVKAEIKAKRG